MICYPFNIMIPNKLKSINKNHQGSSLLSSAHGRVVASATPFYFFLSPHAKNFFRTKPKRTGKKEGGWGEGIFARLLFVLQTRQSNQLPTKSAMFRLVGLPGIEPGLREPESRVIPLYHSPEKITFFN